VNIIGGQQKLSSFILKFYLYRPKEIRSEYYVTERWRLHLTCCLRVCLSLVFRFDAMLCSNLRSENSNEGHIKCYRGPPVLHP